MKLAAVTSFWDLESELLKIVCNHGLSLKRCPRLVKDLCGSIST